MSAPQQSPQTAAAVGNALRGEAEFRTVHYPKSGDLALEAAAGCLAVISQCGITPGQAADILRYLAQRFDRDVALAENWQKSVYLHQRPAPQTDPAPPYVGTPGTGGGTYPWGGSGTSVLDDSTKPTRP